MRRVIGILFGVATHLVFAATVWRLFLFLKPGVHPACGTLSAGSLWTDLALAGQFVVVHSALLHPAVRHRLEPYIGSAFYGCFFCLTTCAQLWLAIALWRGGSQTLWQSRGPAAAALEAGFYGSWIALFYSLWLNGLGHQTGWTPWWHWLRRRPAPRRQFAPRGAYRWLRHPVYLSFLGLIWLRPAMTLDHAILTSVWTPYIFIGSVLKDQRMVFHLGDRYRDYQSRVTGYVGMPAGPLARIPRAQRIPAPQAARGATAVVGVGPPSGAGALKADHAFS